MSRQRNAPSFENTQTSPEAGRRRTLTGPRADDVKVAEQDVVLDVAEFVPLGLAFAVLALGKESDELLDFSDSLLQLFPAFGSVVDVNRAQAELEVRQEKLVMPSG